MFVNKRRKGSYSVTLNRKSLNKLKRKLETRPIKDITEFKYCRKTKGYNQIADCSACELAEPLRHANTHLPMSEIFKQINYKMHPGDRIAVTNCRGETIKCQKKS